MANHPEVSIDAALAMAALANACKDVPGESKCEHIDALRMSGWIISFTIDNDGFHLTGTPPKEKPCEE